MVVRCFSRRFLIPSRSQSSNRHSIQSQVEGVLCSNGKQKSISSSNRSSTFSTHSSRSSFKFDSNFNPNLDHQESKGIDIGSSSLQPSPSSSSSSSYPSIYPHSPSSPSSIKHPKSKPTSNKSSYAPLINNLLRSIYSTHKSPSSDSVWNAYLNLSTSFIDSNGISVPVINKLKLQHHKLVLRAISPSVNHDRNNKKKLSQSRKQGETKLYGNGNQIKSQYRDSEIDIYMQRVWFILSQMRNLQKEQLDLDLHSRGFFDKFDLNLGSSQHSSSQSSSSSRQNEMVPDITDYNHIMSILSKSGHLNHLSTVWNQLNINGQGEGDVLKPTRESYHHLLECLYRNQSSTIKESNLNHQKEKLKNLVSRKGEGLNTKSQLKRIINQESDRFVNEELLKASRINSSRVISILEELRSSSELEINTYTVDLILKNLRISGDFQNFKIVLKEWFGIDLDNPDQSPSNGGNENLLKPSIHTLNTILMTLGEQSSISEMITIFETLGKPLPLNRVEIFKTIEELDLEENSHLVEGKEVLDQGKNLFAIDWSVFKKEKEKEREEGLNEEVENSTSDLSESSTRIPSIFPSTFTTSNLQPNSKIYEILLQHSSSSINKLNLPSTNNPSLRSEEDKKRSNGNYIPISKYLLKDLEENQRKQFELFISDLRTVDSSSNAIPKLDLKVEMLKPLTKLAFKRNDKPSVDWDLIEWLNHYISNNLDLKQSQIQLLEQEISQLDSDSGIQSSSSSSSTISLLMTQLNHSFQSLESLQDFQSDLKEREIKSRKVRNLRLNRRKVRIREMLEKNQEMEKIRLEGEQNRKIEKEKDRERRRMIKEIEKKNKGEKEVEWEEVEEREEEGRHVRDERRNEGKVLMS